MYDPSPAPRDATLCGQLLFSTPVIHEGIFRKSVILVTEHNSGGAHGLILNQPSGKTVSHFLSSPSLASLASVPVHIGGPIGQEHLTFSAFAWSDGKGFQHATRISAKEAAKQMDAPGIILRSFLGYSGWTSGQLEDELRHQSWLSLPPTENILAEELAPALWQNLLRQAGPRYQIIADAPDLPFLN